MAYQPDLVQRRIGILTTAGWLTCVLRVPKLRTLSDHLDSLGEFLRLTDVHFVGSQNAIPFLLLHKTSIFFCTPTETSPTDAPKATGVSSTHQVNLLFDIGTMQGTLETLKNVRISDALMNKNGFLTLRNAQFRVNRGPADNKDFPLVLVNRDRIVGLIEEGAKEEGEKKAEMASQSAK